MKLKPFNGCLLIELPKNDFIVADTEDDINDPYARSGVVVAIPDIEDIMFFGSFNWAFDQSMFDEKTAHRMHAKMTALMGKTVYFPKRAELGNCVEWDGKTYANIDLAKILDRVED